MQEQIKIKITDFDGNKNVLSGINDRDFFCCHSEILDINLIFNPRQVSFRDCSVVVSCASLGLNFKAYLPARALLLL